MIDGVEVGVRVVVQIEAPVEVGAEVGAQQKANKRRAKTMIVISLVRLLSRALGRGQNRGLAQLLRLEPAIDLVREASLLIVSWRLIRKLFLATSSKQDCAAITKEHVVLYYHRMEHTIQQSITHE